MIVPVADRLNKVQEYYFSQKLEQIQKMKAQGIDVINLGIGSPDLVPPPLALQETIQAIQDPSKHSYASYRSSLELREAIRTWYRSTFRIELNPQTEVLPLLGSKEGVLYLSMALLNPGDAVLVPNPGYPAYASVADLLGVRILYYDLTEETGWLPNLDVIQKMNLDRCKLMWVNYPHMPTGQVAPVDLFKRLVDFGRKNRIQICNDNPYGLILNESPPTSILEADPTREVAIELNSLSKSFNMAGWRVGMILGSQRIIDAVLKVKSNVDSGMFQCVQKGAIGALSAPDSWHAERNSIYQNRRTLIWKIFDHLQFTYDPKQVGLFVWAKAPATVPEVHTHLDKILDQAHVFLTPGMIFGSNGNRYARASLCAPEGQLTEAFRRIREFKP